ncbi:hypothetical protein PINS_up022920 [Pythium insidiosum]|nr:hypothetical protein PINS_up022920 [Pythium insidiosum]
MMLESEAAETLMSLSAPDERKFASPLYAADGLPWHSNTRKRSFHAVDEPPSMASSLPSASASFLHDAATLLHRRIHEHPLTHLIPKHRDPEADDDEDDDDRDEDDASSDVDMTSDGSEDRDVWRSYRSPFDGLVAAAENEAHDDDHDTFSSPSSRPISIPSKRMSGGSLEHGFPTMMSRRVDMPKAHKWSLSRVKEDASYIGLDCSPTGVEDDRAWFDSYRSTEEYRQRVRLASICSSEGSTSDYGGLGRKHLEEFIRMRSPPRTRTTRQPARRRVAV